MFLLGLSLFMLVYNLLILNGGITGFSIYDPGFNVSFSPIEMFILLLANIVIITLFSLSYYNWEYYHFKNKKKR